MEIEIRAATLDDAESCGRICYQAFTVIANQHNFPPDFPSAEIAIGVLSKLIAHPGFYGAVAEIDGQIAGSNFLDERSIVAGLGPITIDPAVQNRGVGRALMKDAMARATQRNFPGVRLIQSAYHNRSLSLYTKLGFATREPLATMQGSPLGVEISGYAVRRAVQGDLKKCNRVCFKVHGHDRSGELLDAIRDGTASIIEHDDRITGYATVVGFFGHAIGETNEDVFEIQDEIEEAVTHYRDASRVRPEDYQAIYLSAESLVSLGRSDEALEASRQTLKVADAHLDLNPDDARAWYLSGTALMRLGQRDQALERARRALAIDPEDPGVLYNVACVYALAHSSEEALNYLGKSIQNGMGNREWLDHDSDWDSIRDDPRFQALLRKL